MKHDPIPIDQQVVNLPTSRELDGKLKSVGVEMGSEFQWERHNAKGIGGAWFWNDWIVDYRKDLTGRSEWLQAYTLTEMLSMLPERIEIEEENDLFYIALKKGRIGYWNHNNRIERFIYRINPDTNEATAAAKLMIWLIDNKYVTGVNND
jgi:hypothetical protein